jgi:hypothetical protein
MLAVMAAVVVEALEGQQAPAGQAILQAHLLMGATLHLLLHIKGLMALLVVLTCQVAAAVLALLVRLAVVLALVAMGVMGKHQLLAGHL